MAKTSSASDFKQAARSKHMTAKSAPIASVDSAPVESPPPSEETAATSVETPVAAISPADGATSSPDAAADVVAAKLTDLADRIATALTTCKDAQVVIKGLQKDFARLCKAHNASISSSRKRGGKAGGNAGVPRKVAMGKISEDMAAFLGLNVTDMVTRRDVIQGLNKYIKDNKLQSPEDGRIILPDQKLNDLLKIESGVKLNYFNMQRYINPHFTAIKGEQTAVKASPDTSNGSNGTV